MGLWHCHSFRVEARMGEYDRHERYRMACHTVFNLNGED
jgi:hypothetical protein